MNQFITFSELEVLIINLLYMFGDELRFIFKLQRLESIISSANGNDSTIIDSLLIVHY